jgi:predicted amidohydrolase YtcJ
VSESGPSPADLIIADADVWCGDAARRRARAVAIKGDRIVAVGTDDEVRAFNGPSTEVLTFPGGMVVPGFQDAHVHPSVGARNLMNVNLDDLFTKQDYLARIEAFAAANPGTDWIVGGGWSSGVFTETGGPRKEDLDAVVPDQPVFLLNTDVHAAWMNSRALEAAGLSASTPDPWDGYLVRDPDGSPTGTLQEGAAYDVLRTVATQPSVADWKTYLLRAQQELHSLGITGWQDAWVEPDVLRAYRELADEGSLTARVVTAMWWDRHAGLEQVERLVEQREWAIGGRLVANTIKIMLDGCPESCTGSMLEPYEGTFGERHGKGIQFVEAEALTEAVVALDGRGFQVHQHALGDRAVRSGLDAIEAARSANGWNDARHHIAHLQLPDPVDLPRLRRLGVVANLQTFWAQPDPVITEITTPRVGERAARLYPFGSIHASGAVLCMGSDWPVSTPNPWLQMEVAVTRQPIGSPDADSLDVSQRLDLTTAMAAFARGSAYVNHDDEAGVLAVGMRADLAVVDRDPFDRSLGSIGETTTQLTIAGGRVVFDRAASSA